MVQLLVLILFLLLIILGISRAPRRVTRAAEPRERRPLASTPTQAPASGQYEGPSTATYRNWFIVSAGIPLGVLAAVLTMVVVIGHLLATGGMETSSTDTIARNVGILMLAASILGPLCIWGQVRTAAHSARWDAQGVTVISYGGRADRFAWEDLDSLHTFHPRLGLRSYEALMVCDTAGRAFTLLKRDGTFSPAFAALAAALKEHAGVSDARSR